MKCIISAGKIQYGILPAIGLVSMLAFQSCCIQCLTPSSASRISTPEKQAYSLPESNSRVADGTASVPLQPAALWETIVPSTDSLNHGLSMGSEENPVLISTTDPLPEPSLSPSPNYIPGHPPPPPALSFVVYRDSKQKASSAYIRYKEKEKLPLGIRSIESFIVAGPNLSFKRSNEGDDVYGGAEHQHKPGVGFQVGAGVNLNFNMKFSVSTGLIFKQNNASEEIKGMGYSTIDKYSYNFLSVPLLASFRVNNNLELLAGPEINYLLSARVKHTGDDYSGGENYNLTDGSVRLGVGLQAGIKYSKGQDSRLGAQLIYDYRISRLNKKHGDYDTPGWYMQGLQLSLIWSLCEK